MCEDLLSCILQVLIWDLIGVTSNNVVRVRNPNEWECMDILLTRGVDEVDRQTMLAQALCSDGETDFDEYPDGFVIWQKV